MTAFPSRGQKAPDYWDGQLKSYIDEADATKADADDVASSLAGKADTGDVDAALAQKADADDVAAALSDKADSDDLGTAAALDTGTTVGKVPVLGANGVLAVARLATGAPDGTKFVRDDGTLATPPGGGGTFATAIPWSDFTIQKDPVTGFWPASWSGMSPVYTGGSDSEGVRPTSRADLVFSWRGPDPSPSIVNSGVGGMRDGVDERKITP